MKAQEIFNKVATHLLTQGHGACDLAGGCLYRGPEGTSCAVGAIMPDRYYKKSMENKGITELVKSFDIPKWMINNAVLLNQLQDIHDTRTHVDHGEVVAFETNELKEALYSVALDHGLNADVLGNKEEFWVEEEDDDFVY